MKILKTVMRPSSFERGLRDFCNEVRSYLGDAPTIVELGSYIGESSEIFAQEFPNGKIICIDSWEGGFDDSDSASHANYVDVEEQFNLRISEYPNIEKIKGYSTDHSIECDMVYIDACHKYECVTEDIRHWKPLVKKIISGHDYHTEDFIQKHPHVGGVKIAVNDSLGVPDMTFEDGSWFKKIKNELYWFTGLNNHNKTSYLKYIKMYKVAVITAKSTNPSIKPILILDGEIDENINELINIGVEVISHRVSFYDDLKNHYKDDTIAYGAFLRVDIPLICEKLGIEESHVLYTDNDVMFMSDVSELFENKTETFMCAGEFTKVGKHWDMNSGVMWLNWRFLLNTHQDFVSFIKLNFKKFNVYDQDAYKLFYNKSIERLNYKFNYKPYWGPFSDIKILHFHGPKPTFVDEDFTNYPYKNLVSPFFNEMKNKFNQLHDNYNLLNA